jgi:hypothetical protein
VVRWDRLNIGFFLLADAFRQALQLVAQMLDLSVHDLALPTIHRGGFRPGQSSLGAVQNHGCQVQIALQGGSPGRGSGGFGGRLGGEAPRAVQEQSLHFAQRPDHRFHRAPAPVVAGPPSACSRR